MLLFDKWAIFPSKVHCWRSFTEKYYNLSNWCGVWSLPTPLLTVFLPLTNPKNKLGLITAFFFYRMFSKTKSSLQSVRRVLVLEECCLCRVLVTKISSILVSKTSLKVIEVIHNSQFQTTKNLRAGYLQDIFFKTVLKKKSCRKVVEIT